MYFRIKKRLAQATTREQALGERLKILHYTQENVLLDRDALQGEVRGRGLLVLHYILLLYIQRVSVTHL